MDSWFPIPQEPSGRQLLESRNSRRADVGMGGSKAANSGCVPGVHVLKGLLNP